MGQPASSSPYPRPMGRLMRAVVGHRDVVTDAEQYDDDYWSYAPQQPLAMETTRVGASSTEFSSSACHSARRYRKMRRTRRCAPRRAARLPMDLGPRCTARASPRARRKRNSQFSMLTSSAPSVTHREYLQILHVRWTLVQEAMMESEPELGWTDSKESGSGFGRGIQNVWVETQQSARALPQGRRTLGSAAAMMPGILQTVTSDSPPTNRSDP